MGSNRGVGAPTLIVAAAPMRGADRADRRDHRALHPQRTGRGRGAEDHVVRRERRGAGARHRGGVLRGDLRQHPRRALRGHRLERVRRAWTAGWSLRRCRRVAWPASQGQLLLEALAAARRCRRARRPSLLDATSAAVTEAFLVSTGRHVQPIRHGSTSASARAPARSPRCRQGVARAYADHRTPDRAVGRSQAGREVDHVADGHRVVGPVVGRAPRSEPSSVDVVRGPHELPRRACSTRTRRSRS